jgi:hypothetical protein
MSPGDFMNPWSGALSGPPGRIEKAKDEHNLLS